MYIDSEMYAHVVPLLRVSTRMIFVKKAYFPTYTNWVWHCTCACVTCFEHSNIIHVLSGIWPIYISADGGGVRIQHLHSI